MENPATWNKATCVIDAALTKAAEQQKQGIIGQSTAGIIHDALEREHLLVPEGWVKVTPETMPETGREYWVWGPAFRHPKKDYLIYGGNGPEWQILC